MPEWTAWVRVRTSTSTRTRPRRLVVRAGTPMSQLPLSAITMTSARSSSRCCFSSAGQAVGADLLLALDEHHDVDRQVVAVDAEGAEVGGDAGLVVGGAAGVEAAVALGRLERRGVPVGVVVLGLDVVVGVEQHRRRALAGRLLVRDHRRAAAVGAGDLDVEALGGEQVAHGLGAALHLAGPLRVGADRLDPDQGLEVTSYAGKDVAHPRAEVVIAHAAANLPRPGIVPDGSAAIRRFPTDRIVRDYPDDAQNCLTIIWRPGWWCETMGDVRVPAIPSAPKAALMNHSTPATAHHIELTETYAAHNYHPLPRGARLRRGRLGHRRRRQALPRLPRRLLRAQLRPRPPAPRRGRARAARPPDADQPRVLQRPARPVLRGARRPHRQGDDPADELRRRGRRDRDQGQPQVGLPGQGRAGEPGDDRRDGGQLPRAHHHDRVVLDRPRRDARLRAVHPGLPARAVRRHRGAAGGDRRHHGGRAARAGAGRGRRGHPAARATCQDVRALCRDAAAC